MERYYLQYPHLWEELESQAFGCVENISALSPEEQLCYQELTTFYSPGHIVQTYENWEQTHENRKQVYVQYQEAVRKAGTLISEIEKAQTADEIARLACQAIGLMTGDDSFYPRQMQKLEI